MLTKQWCDISVESLLHAAMTKLVLRVYLNYTCKVVFSITTKRGFSKVFFDRLMGPFHELLKYENCTRCYICNN